VSVERQAHGRALGAIATAAALMTIAVIAWGTRPFGPGLYGDGAGYLSAAESLVRSGHLRVMGAPYWSADSLAPLRQWPPGFPLAIAIPLHAGLNLMAAVTVVQMLAAVIIAAVTVALVGRVLSPGWAALTAAAVLVTPGVLATEMNVVSEPLYIACLAMLVWAMTWHPDRVLVSGTIAAALVMIRYLGVAAVVAVGLWAIARPLPLQQRVRRGFAAVLPGVLAYGAWALIVRRGGGGVSTAIVDHQVGGILRAFVGATAAWLAPWTEGPGWLHVAAKVCIGGLAALALVLVARGRTTTNASRALTDGDDVVRPRLIAACGVLAICHLGVLLAARVLTSRVEFSARTYAPVYYLFAVMGIVALGMAWSASRRAGAVAAAAAGLWLVGCVVASAESLRESRSVGLDHARAEERASPTLAWLRAHAAEAPIYTNEPAKVYFYLHRSARSLPWIVTEDTLRHMNDIFRQRPGYVVWFAGGQAALYVPPPLMAHALSLDKLKAGSHLMPVMQLDDGVVMVPDSASPKAAS
jgi:hypothetical protein